MKDPLRAALFTFSALITATCANAANLDMMVAEDNTKVPVLLDMIERYEAQNPGTDIRLNVVSYNVLLEQLPEQLEAGVGPDLAMITRLGALNAYFVDLTPYVDVNEWRNAYGTVLKWYCDETAEGIYGFQAEMTVSGPYVNLTMFDRADVDVPGPDASWDDWAMATMEVMDRLGSYAGMAMDRSGHRFAGPAMSYGAAYYDPQGNLTVDNGFAAFSERMLDWHEKGLMPPDIWPAMAGSKYADGNELFFRQEVPFYMSGSWNIATVQRNVGKSFDWTVVPPPCGPAGCGVMPGGSGIVALRSGDADMEREAARFVAWLGAKEQAREWYTRVFAIPAHTGLQDEGLDYEAAGASHAVSDGLATYTAAAARAAKETPQAFRLQGDPRAYLMFNATTEYLAAAMNDQMSLDEALQMIGNIVRTQTSN